MPELLLSIHNTVLGTKKAICTHAGGVYITRQCLVFTEHPEILFILRIAARVLWLEDHCGDSALWPQPESEPSLAEHSLSSLCTARQGRAEMDRQSQAPARAELRAVCFHHSRRSGGHFWAWMSSTPGGPTVKASGSSENLLGLLWGSGRAL